MGEQADVVFTGGARLHRRPGGPRRAGPGRIRAAGQRGRRARRPDRRRRRRRRRGITDLIGRRTEVVDLRGRALLPGFQDAHVHPGVRGRDDDRVQPDRRGQPGRRARQDQRLRGPAPGQGVDRGQRLAHGVVRPRHAETASSSTRSPAAGRPTSPTATATAPGPAPARWSWPASTPHTPDPPDGRIERGADGSAQGTLHEGAASLVGRHVPALTLDDRVRGLLLAQEHLHARGITAWQDAIVGDYLGSGDPLPAYLAAASGREADRPGPGCPLVGPRPGQRSSCPTSWPAGSRARQAGSARTPSRSCRTGSRRASPPG